MAARKKTPGRWTSRQLATRIARLADDKLAERVVILDVAQAIQVADYFVICDGQNGRHLGVVAEHVARELKQHGVYRMGGSPLADENWVLLDFGPVVLHAFTPKARSHYDLENLWGDCPKVKWRRTAAAKPAKAAKPAAKRRRAADDDIPTGEGFAPPVE